MSKENVALVRGLLDAFARGEHESAFDLYDSEIEWDASGTSKATPDLAGVYRGHDGVRTYWRRWLSAWKDLQFEVDDVRGAGDEVVALISNQHMKGRHSGIEVEMPPFGLVFTIHDGKVTRWRSFSDQRSALEAAGFSE